MSLLSSTKSTMWMVPILGLIFFPVLEGWGLLMLPAVLVAAGAWLALRQRDQAAAAIKAEPGTPRSGP